MNSVSESHSSANTASTWFSTLRDYLELIRFSHTIFALPFAVLVSVWAWLLTARKADQPPMTWLQALGILICMVAARSFAMSFNRLADAKLDAANPRTKNRHLPSGRLAFHRVVLFSAGCCLLFVAGTLLFLPNRLPLVLSLPVLVFLAGYSLAKRFTVFVHFWLGIALGCAPLCAWIALRGEMVAKDGRDILPAILVGLGVMFWVAGFDMIYASQDAAVDRELGLKSLPAKLGVAGALRVAAVCHALMLLPLASLIWLCPDLNLGLIFGLALIMVSLLLVYEHSMVSANNLAKVNVAFFQTNAVISLAILIAGILDAWMVYA